MDSFMNKCVIFLFVFLLIFTITMIVLYCVFQSVPDALIAAVYGFCGGECGFLALIKNCKTKHKKKNHDEST